MAHQRLSALQWHSCQFIDPAWSVGAIITKRGGSGMYDRNMNKCQYCRDFIGFGLRGVNHEETQGKQHGT